MKPAHILLISACLLVLTACPVSADIAEIPSIPVQFYGTLYNHEGKPFPAGTVITAETGGITSTFTLAEEGKIGGPGTFDDKFLISGAVAGNEITFRIVGTDVSVTRTYNPTSAQQIEQIQLTVTAEIPAASGQVPTLPTETQTAVPELPTETPESQIPALPTEDIAPTPTKPAASPAPIAGVLLALAFAIVAGRKSL